MDTIFGIDGCKSGWFVAQSQDNKAINFMLIESLDNINDFTKKSAVMGIDIPLELHEKGTRMAEKEARVILGRRASTIFSPPAIKTLNAKTYFDACRINYNEEGKKISKQTWHIFNKIKEARKIYLDKASNKKLFEIHPELSFMAMNHMQVLIDSKKTIEGRKKRLKLINGYYPFFSFDDVRGKFSSKDVADDDILDAIAVLWSTQKIIDNIASYVPKKPETPKSKIYF